MERRDGAELAGAVEQPEAESETGSQSQVREFFDNSGGDKEIQNKKID
jgi:hypothetical protein